MRDAGVGIQLGADKEPLSTRITDQQLVEELGKLPLMFQPGTSWEYGRSIDVLLALVEKVSGQRADQFFQERIFQPLGMTDTFFNVPPDKLDRVAQPGPDPDTHETAKLTDVTKTRTFLGGGEGLLSTASDYIRFALMLANGGEFLVLESPELANEVGRLVRRNAAFDRVAVLPDMQGRAALSPNRRWLLAGGFHLEGRIASAVLVDLPAWSIVRTLPLTPPFAWVDDETFVAQTPIFRTETRSGRMEPTTRLVDDAIAATAPHLLDVAPGLVLVNRTTLAARCLLAFRPLDEEVACALSADKSVLFSVTGFARTSAVRIADGTLVFQHPPSRNVVEGTVYDMAYNAARDEIITAGGGPDPVRIFDAMTGADRLRLNPNQPIVRGGLRPPRRFGAIAVHRDGRVAIGTDTGLLLEMASDGTRTTACQAAPREIQALAYTHDGSALVIGGNERALRILPLE
jgi:hypothetical protein